MSERCVELVNSPARRARGVTRAMAALATLTRLARRAVAAGALLLVVGCSGSPAPTVADPARPPGDPAVTATSALSQRYQALTDKLCACTDAACTARATASFANAEDRTILDPEQIARWASEPAVAAVTRRMTECVAVQVRNAARAHRRADARQMMEGYALFVDEICACTDQECSTRVTENYSRAIADAARDLDPEDAKAMAVDPRMEALTKQWTDCATRTPNSASQPP
jgi:hypothetical protein